MNKFQITPPDALALVALAALAIGISLVHGVGWALIVISSLVLIYLVVPDQKPGGPTP